MTSFGDPFRDFDALYEQLTGTDPAAPPSPPLDAYRRGHDVWIHIDLPGISPESIHVTLEQGRLDVAAERTWHEQSDDQIYARERPAGQLHRSIRLGSGLDPDGLEADYHDGVLTLRIPLAEHARPRRIPITTDRPAAIDVESTLVDHPRNEDDDHSER